LLVKAPLPVTTTPVTVGVGVEVDFFEHAAASVAASKTATLIRIMKCLLERRKLCLRDN